MRQGTDPKLRECINEMEAVAKKHSVMFCGFIASGHGHSEYGLFADLPWSYLKVSSTECRVKTNKEDPDKMEKLSRTVNAVFCLKDPLEKISSLVKGIARMLDQNIEIEHEKNATYSPRLD